MRVGLYRFNEVVDEENEILLNSYPNEKSQLLEAISKLKFNNSKGKLFFEINFFMNGKFFELNSKQCIKAFS